MGRPVGSTIDNPMSTQLPVIRVTPQKLTEYKEAADASGSNFSQWVRSTLDMGVKKKNR